MEEFLSTELIKIKDYKLELGTLIVLVIFIALVVGILKLVKKLIYRSNRLKTGEKFSINKIVRIDGAAERSGKSLRLKQKHHPTGGVFSKLVPAFSQNPVFLLP